MAKHVFLNRAIVNLSVGPFVFRRNRCELDSEEARDELARLISQLPLSQQHEFAYLPPDKSVEEAIFESTMALLNGNGDPDSPEAQAVAAALKARIDAELASKQVVDGAEDSNGKSMMAPLGKDSAKLIQDTLLKGAKTTTVQGAATTTTIVDKAVDESKKAV